MIHATHSRGSEHVEEVSIRILRLFCHFKPCLVW